MRRLTALLLSLALLAMLCVTATAEEQTGIIAFEAQASGDEEFITTDEVDLSIPEAEEGLLAPEAFVQDEDAALPAEGLAQNASVPTKLSLGVKESYTLKVSGAKKFKSSNTKYATVSSKGVVKGKAVGSANITITLNDGSTLKVKVSVLKAPDKVSLKKKSLSLGVGETYTLKASLPSKTASQLSWKSSKKSVVKVDSNGKLTALKAGSATITVSTFNKVTAKCTVKVSHKVGVSMPTKDLTRWKSDGSRIQSKLVKEGYTVDLQYASNDVSRQVKQIKAMIDGGCEALIIAPIEGNSLSNVLESASEKGIPVIAYDRLILGSDAVSYYITFDNYQVGALQGSYIRDALNLKKAKGPFNIEFTAGDPGDRNALVFYEGAMDVLNPYIKSGKLKVRSGKTSFEDVATPTWGTDVAHSRAQKIIKSYYTGSNELDAWLCSNDSTALGIIAALTASDYSGKWPIITGQDCDIENVKNIIAGKQSMSVFKDTGILADRAATMTKQILSGKSVSVTDTTTYDNGAKVVPAYLCTPTVVTADNYKKVLIDSGFYTKSMLK